MEKELTFKYEGSTYTLSFNRKTVQQLTRQGFKPDMITEQPAIGIPMLFKGAFLVHHRMIRDDLTDKIWESLKNKSELIGKLMEMYVEPINELISEPEEDEEKNVDWGANF
jgi:hypothetical protein